MSLVRCTVRIMARGQAGHIERLPSGSWRVKVYAGTDPLTGRELRLRKTCRTERAAQIELGKLLEHAAAGRQPDSDVTAAQLLDQYVSTAGWDVSTRESNLGYIRRTIKPALGSTQVRKVRGPLLDTLYARLMRCGNLACTGRPFTEHRNIPDLRPDPADPRRAARLQGARCADRRHLCPGGRRPRLGKRPPDGDGGTYRVRPRALTRAVAATRFPENDVDHLARTIPYRWPATGTIHKTRRSSRRHRARAPGCKARHTTNPP